MPRRGFRRFGASLLLLNALAGGPGIVALEIRSHTERNVSPHGTLPHFEAQGAQDHGDRCEIGLVATPARTPIGGCPTLRFGSEATTPLQSSDSSRWPPPSPSPSAITRSAPRWFSILTE
jgi:hypothetical protein